MQLNNKVVAIMQPTFLPWLGYFHMIKQSDVFVFLDDVQVTKRSWQTRNRLKSSSGEYFVTVPIKKGNSRSLIKDCEVAIDSSWKDNLFKSIDFSYSKSEKYNDNKDFILSLFSQEFKFLSELNCFIIESISRNLGIQTEFIKSSELNSTGKRDDYLSSICLELEGKTYLSAQGSREYIESGENFFTKKGIDVVYNNYNHPVYNQQYGSFISHLSVIDAIFNIGIDSLKSII